MSVSGLSDTLAPGLAHETALKRPLCFVQRGLVPILARVIGRRFRVRVRWLGIGLDCNPSISIGRDVVIVPEQVSKGQSLQISSGGANYGNN